MFGGGRAAKPRPKNRERVQKRPRGNGVPRSRNSQAREQRRYRRKHPEEFPDLDFHQSFGSFLTRKNPVDKTIDREIAGYWRMLTERPSELQYQVFDIRERYRKTFRRYFKAQVISLHGHVSDGANPNLLMSLLLHLMEKAGGLESDSESDSASNSRNDAANIPASESASIPVRDDANTPASHDASISACDWVSSSTSDDASGSTSGYTVDDVDLLEHANRDSPRIALTQGSYGAVYGPMAYECVLPYVRSLANGPQPFFVNIQDPTTINGQVREAKAEGCIALIAEIVCAADGSVISTIAWKNLLSACREHCLVLIVDEALTAIRCGAPFAYQLSRYAKYGFPDLVLFGKAVRTNGIAVEWRGINIRKLGINLKHKRLDAVLDWQDRFTALATSQDLLTSWGNTESPIMVANAGTYVRLLPTMDEVMTSRAQLLTKVFGASSIPHRAELAAFLKRYDFEMHWCSKCGHAVDEEEQNEKSCERCVVRQCRKCAPSRHVCPM